MPATQVVMPQLGESVVEGTIVRWLVKPGQAVARDESLVEVATDKANTEVPSPSNGVVTAISAAEGAVVPVGGLLCTLDEAGAAAGAASPNPAAVGPLGTPTAANKPAAPVSDMVTDEFAALFDSQRFHSGQVVFPVAVANHDGRERLSRENRPGEIGLHE